MTNTSTPRTDDCPHCGAEYKRQEDADYLCGSIYWPHTKSVERSELCKEREARQKAEAELAELWSRFDKQMQAEAEVERLQRLMSRLCESVSENWDEGIADYFMDEMNKTYNEIHPQHK